MGGFVWFASCVSGGSPLCPTRRPLNAQHSANSRGVETAGASDTTSSDKPAVAWTARRRSTSFTQSSLPTEESRRESARTVILPAVVRLLFYVTYKWYLLLWMHWVSWSAPFLRAFNGFCVSSRCLRGIVLGLIKPLLTSNMS